jgi:Flp pilus assembly protein TadG
MIGNAGSGPGRNVFRPGHPASRQGFLRQDEGAAIVEFAIVITLFVMLVFGIVEFGRAYQANSQLTHATREGVRELAISGDQAAAVSNTRTAAGSLDLTALEVTVNSCSPGQMARVTARYPFQYEIPLFGSATLTLESEAVMRCGG